MCFKLGCFLLVLLHNTILNIYTYINAYISLHFLSFIYYFILLLYIIKIASRKAQKYQYFLKKIILSIICLYWIFGRQETRGERWMYGFIVIKLNLNCESHAAALQSLLKLLFAKLSLDKSLEKICFSLSIHPHYMVGIALMNLFEKHHLNNCSSVVWTEGWNEGKITHF